MLARPAIRAAALATVLILIAALPSVRAKPAVEDLVPFEADASTLRELADDVPVDESAGVVLLLHEGRYTVDEQHRSVLYQRLIYRVDAAAAVGPWSTIEVMWSPWHQHPPEIRARVITVDGREHALDPATLGEYSATAPQPELFGDNKSLAGPLPAVAVGAVVETEYIIREHEPFFAVGARDSFIVSVPVPVRHTRIVIDVPESLPLHYVARQLPEHEFKKKAKRGRVVLSYDIGPQPAREIVETHAPKEIPRGAYVAFSTAPDWQAVAARYAEIVDERIASGDVGKRAKKIRKGNKDRDEIIAAALASIHDEVRYTGVEFGDQAIIPTPPTETLSLRFGDCKDTATLMVALLRELGIESYVALLQAGEGADIEPSLPGLGGFNHAIVHVPGPEPLWIDTTVRYARLGELPVSDQGRHALIASKATRDVIETPWLAPETNRQIETREIFLQMSGGARIVETTRWHGHYEQTHRAYYSQIPAEGLGEIFDSYATSTYGAEELVAWETSDFEDLSQPLTLRLEMTGISSAWTTAPWASVYMQIGGLTEMLPEALILLPDEGSAEAGATHGAAVSNNGQDFVVPVPHVVEWHYIIHLPPGYVARELPESGERRFGGAVLTASFSKPDHEQVRADFRFESGKRYTAEQVVALRKEINAFYEEDATLISLEQLGEVYLGEGRIREALQEFRKLAERYPDEPSNRSQLARALLAAGFGEHAREEARRAVELSPGSAAAHRALGVVLAHDLLGRKYHRGFDRAGAAAALRKAKQLDPEDPDCRGELALLLEYDADGVLFGSAAELPSAVEEMQALRDELDYPWYDDYLLMALLRSGRLEELESLADEADAAGSQYVMQVVAAAALHGTEKARDKASRMGLDPETHRNLLVQAAQILQSVREYESAADLMTAGSRGHEQAISLLAQAQLLRGTRRHEAIEASTASPEGVVRRFMLSAFSGKTSREEMRGLLAPATHELLETEQFGDNMFTALSRFTTMLHHQFGSMDPVLDLLTTRQQMSVEGDDATGYRVRTWFQGQAHQQTDSEAYIVRVGEEYRIAAFEPEYAGIGLQVLEFVAQENEAAARRWLDWAYESIPPRVGGDPMYEHRFRSFWTPGKQADAERMRQAAAVLMLYELSHAEARSILESGREQADAELRPAFDAVLHIAASRRDDVEGELELARALRAAFPDSNGAFAALIIALASARQWDEAQSLLDARLERRPTDTEALRFAAQVADMRGDHERSRGLYRKLVATGKATPDDYNNMAWVDVVLGTVTDDTLLLAQQAAVAEDMTSSASLHTLATVFADLDRPDEARDVLLKVVDSRVDDELEPHDWYILGRMAEGYELPQVASAAYARVEPPESDPLGGSTYAIAQRRIAGLTRAEQAE